jgi:hypothetical protein
MHRKISSKRDVMTIDFSCFFRLGNLFSLWEAGTIKAGYYWVILSSQDIAAKRRLIAIHLLNLIKLSGKWRNSICSWFSMQWNLVKLNWWFDEFFFEFDCLLWRLAIIFNVQTFGRNNEGLNLLNKCQKIDMINVNKTEKRKSHQKIVWTSVFSKLLANFYY